jgi:hypothetical protein
VAAATRRARRSRESTREIIDRLVARAAGGEPATFVELAAAAGLDPAHDFIGASLEGRSFRGEDLRGLKGPSLAISPNLPPHRRRRSPTGRRR